MDQNHEPADALPQDFRSEGVALGKLILAAYAMSTDPSNLNPPLPPNFPSNYMVFANVLMKDFVPAIGYSFYQFYGFLAVKKGTGEFCIVMRGTLTIVEWIDNIYSMSSVPFFNYGNVGYSWAKIYTTMQTSPRSGAVATSEQAAQIPYKSFAAQVHDIVSAHVAENALAATSTTMDCAGHSLGAALITLYTLERRGEDDTYPIRSFYTFASPLVGDQTFKSAFDRQRFDKYRIFNTSDPVPNMPYFTDFKPVDQPRSYNLPSNYYTWDPLCSHSMDTYLHLLDPSHAPSYYCRHLFEQSDATLHATAKRPTAGAADPSRNGPAPAVQVVSGSTKITITIETGGKCC